MTHRRAIIGGVAIGILVPAVIMCLDSWSTHGWWPAWVLWVWPSSYMLLATAGKKEAWDYLIIVFAVLVNGALYGYLFSVLYRLRPSVRA